MEPESNHTSIMSVSLEKWALPHLGHTKPSGSRSRGSLSNQMLEPCSRKSRATLAMVSGVTMSAPQSSQ